MEFLKQCARALFAIALLAAAQGKIHADMEIKSLRPIDFENTTGIEEAVLLTEPDGSGHWLASNLSRRGTGVKTLYFKDSSTPFLVTATTGIETIEGGGVTTTRSTTFTIAPGDKRFKVSIDGNNKLVVTKVG